MGGFSADWLQLREPVDHASRSATLTDKLAAFVGRQHSPSIIDLGAGTGSNLRYLLPHLGLHQRWLLVDHDADLLARLPEKLSAWADEMQLRMTVTDNVIHLDHVGFSARVERLPLDLATRLDRLPFANTNLVTAAALLDLTATDWIDRLADACIEHELSCLCTLNVDGRHLWLPTHPLDTAVGTAFNAHLERDKGFGPAAGSRAGQHLHDRLHAAGHDTRLDRCDWQLSGEHTTLMRELVSGIAAAAIEQEPTRQQAFGQWLRARHQAIDAGQGSLVVGHLDVLGIPSCESSE